MSVRFEELSAGELAAAIRTRKMSAREAVEAHDARIDEVDATINAVVTQCRERAFAEAARADELTASGADLPPLHGVPMTHEDTHDTEGIRTILGTPLFADHVPDVDDVVPEFAAGSHTFDEVFGTTTNPYDPTRSPGGSRRRPDPRVPLACPADGSACAAALAGGRRDEDRPLAGVRVGLTTDLGLGGRSGPASSRWCTRRRRSSRSSAPRWSWPAPTCATPTRSSTSPAPSTWRCTRRP